MSAKQTIIINGRHYDARTGLAVHDPTPHAVAPVAPAPAHHKPRASVSSGHIHGTAQRSHTLNRKAIKRPEPQRRATTDQVHVNVTTPAAKLHSAPKHAGTSHEIIRRKSPTPAAHRPSAPSTNHITKFAPHPVAPATAKRVVDIAPVTHPTVAKAHVISKAKADAPLPRTAPEPRKTAQEIKRSTISQAVANTSVNHQQHPKKHLLRRKPRALSIVSASIAIVMLGGYLTYLNMPSLSVRVAAAQAGINANYPNYHPDGYSLNGLVGFSEGKVTMKFAAAGSPQTYTINQTKSNWDSVAVLDNYVTPRAGVSYIPYTERGLTIYTYGNNAAWVNGGILYTIEGNAPLSSEQIRRIATSLI